MTRCEFQMYIILMAKCLFSRYEILKLSYETLKNTEIERQTIDTLEMAMWKSCILAGPENIKFDRNDGIFNKLKTELLSGLNDLQAACSLVDENEERSAEALMNRLIDLGKLDIAMRISKIFNCNHKVSDARGCVRVFLSVQFLIKHPE